MPEIRSYNEIPLIQTTSENLEQVGTFYAEMYRQHGPIFRRVLSQSEQEVVILVGPEANRFVQVSGRHLLSHQLGWGEAFGIDRLLGRGLLTMDGAEHNYHRKIMNPAFTLGYMERYLPLMQRVIQRRAARWVESPAIDLLTELRKITFDIAAEALTGLVVEAEIDTFRRLFVGLLSDPGGIESEEDYRAYIEPLQQELHALLVPRIEERRQHPTDDVFGLLVQARDADGQALSVEQLISHVNILLVAGHETSTSLSTWLFYLLNQHPDYLQRVLAEQAELLTPGVEATLGDIKGMKVLENAMSEAERLYPPVSLGPRGAFEDFEFHGYHVPAKTLVFYSIAGSHMLPDIFANPERFDPDRFAPPREEEKKHPYALVGFGGGPRICIGINFAQVEMKALVSHVLRHYELELASDQEVTPSFEATLRPQNGVIMKVTPRTTPISLS